MESGRSRRGRRTANSFGGALGLTVAGALIPGVAFLAAGRRKLGAAILLLFLLAVGAGVWLATAGRTQAIHWVVSSSSLLWIIAVVAALALCWVLVVAIGYRMLAPSSTRAWQHAIGALVVLVLAAVVGLPAYEVTHLAGVQRSLITEVFGHHRSATAPQDATSFAERRVNVLLLGGDSGPGRDGVRTDTVVVASIDTRTGDTTMFSLPRNLENLPFPPGSALAQAYPHGFTAASEDEGLLNAVYRNGPAAHPGLIGPSDDPGADWLKLGVGQALGLHIDYYVLVNMEGFSRLVDALGGITVNINYWVPIGGIPDQQLPDDYFRPGPNQHLDGWHALQYARGRYGLSDYLRMQRQRCVLNAVLKAADPVTVLQSYQDLAETTEGMVRTDIPQSVLDDFVDVGLEAKHARIRSVVFDTSVIDPAYPDYAKMRAVVASALATAGEPTTAARGSGVTPTTPPEQPVTVGPTPPVVPAPSTSGSPVADVTSACAFDPAQAQAALAAGEPPVRRNR